jgi:hypothetical protein
VCHRKTAADKHIVLTGFFSWFLANGQIGSLFALPLKEEEEVPLFHYFSTKAPNQAKKNDAMSDEDDEKIPSSDELSPASLLLLYLLRRRRLQEATAYKEQVRFIASDRFTCSFRHCFSFFCFF